MGIRRRQDAAATILGLLQVFFLFHSASKFMLPLLPRLISNKHTALRSSELILNPQSYRWIACLLFFYLVPSLDCLGYRS